MKKTDTKDLLLKDKLLKGVKNILIVTVVALFVTAGIALQISYDTAIKEKEQGFDVEIKTAVDNLISTLSVNYARYENGEITEAEALATAEQLVRDSRYNNGNGYFWADMADGLCVVHMNPEYEGTMRFERKTKKVLITYKILLKQGTTGPLIQNFISPNRKKTASLRKELTPKSLNHTAGISAPGIITMILTVKYLSSEASRLFPVLC
ncbi:cache domain-containing protein [Clostridium sp. KNHs205]|uniref:cache domain-containing protein n=1 Tax=Clostridium sp. KNHs205 TaxID=1449050 RepID=UPI00068C1E77|nr:cache domain-containing protein [Clostridium sp. KNHs205]